MYGGKVELCGVDTSRLPVLTEAEKSTLLRAARAGDQAARQQMIQGNLRLVLSVVQKFANRGQNLDDLFQVGCIGLIKAIDNFDPALNVRFSTYGVPMIVGEIRRFLRDNNAVRVSRSIRDLAYHAMQAREALQKENGREPKVSEIAARVGRYAGKRRHCIGIGGGTGQFCMNRSTRTAATALRWWTSCTTPPARKAGSAASCSAIPSRRSPRGNGASLPCGTCTARPRPRSRGRSASARRRSAGWKKARWSISKTRSHPAAKKPGGGSCEPPPGSFAGSGALRVELQPAGVQRAQEGFRVFVQDAGDAQVVGGLALILLSSTKIDSSYASLHWRISVV